MTFGVDIEPTNRCNAKCYFCPRDATPHQGLMTSEVFEQSLARCDELRGKLQVLERPELKISLCGLGEPLLNKLTPSFVSRVRAEGFSCTMSSNAALLDERRSNELLEAGLQKICINVGDREADYEEIYKLPWERTRDNILQFKELAGDECEIYIVLVDHRQDRAHLDNQRAYWSDHGMRAFMEYEIMNRGGALFVDHMQFDSLPQLAEAKALLAASGSEALCPTPFVYLFVGYDGQYYLCCSDWTKEAPLGSVFDASFSEVMAAKLSHVRTRRPVCETCNLDPLNKVTEALRARDAGEADAPDIADLVARVGRTTTFVLNEIEALTGQPAPGLDATATTQRRNIPVTAL